MALNRNRIEVPAAPAAGGAFDQRTATALAALRARVPNTGTTTLHFGAFPGAADARVDVIDQLGIVETSIVQAWLRPAATPDHTADEHLVEPIRVHAGEIRPGVGFTIYGIYVGDGDTLAYGQWSVAWSWT